MYKCLISQLFLMFSCSVMATTFAPISIKKQIKQSDGVVYGEVLDIEAYEDGDIINSKVTILANKWIGVNPQDNQLVLHFPGGKINQKIFKVHGSPKFELGETVVVLVRKYKGNFWINNLGLGKFSIKNIGKGSVIVNQVFPTHPDVGQMNLNKFFELSQWVKKTKFEERFKDKYEIGYENEMRKKIIKGRAVASVNLDDAEESRNISIIWLLILLGLFGFVHRVIKNRSQ